MFDGGRRVGGDSARTEPGRIIGLVESVPLLLIHGAADRTVPRPTAAGWPRLAGRAAEHWEVPGADHGEATRAAPAHMRRG